MINDDSLLEEIKNLKYEISDSRSENEKLRKDIYFLKRELMDIKYEFYCSMSEKEMLVQYFKPNLG